MEKAVGPKCGTFISAVVLLFTWGVCIVYHVIISTNLNDFFIEQNLITTEILPGLENRRFWLLVRSYIWFPINDRSCEQYVNVRSQDWGAQVTTVGVVIPLCMLPNFNKLKYAASFATTSMVYLTAVIAAYLFISSSRTREMHARARTEPAICKPCMTDIDMYI